MSDRKELSFLRTASESFISKDNHTGVSSAYSEQEITRGCKYSTKPASVNREVMAQNVLDDCLTLAFDLGHSKSIGFLGPIRSYLGPTLKFIS